jgi:hypothetical protein
MIHPTNRRASEITEARGNCRDACRRSNYEPIRQLPFGLADGSFSPWSDSITTASILAKPKTINKCRGPLVTGWRQSHNRDRAVARQRAFRSSFAATLVDLTWKRSKAQSTCS